MGILDAPARGVNPADSGYDIVLGLGQSNMSGQGTPVDAARFDATDPRVWQYGTTGTYANVISLAQDPLAHHDTPPGVGPMLAFGRWYAGLISPNRKVLLVPCGHASTGFADDGGTGFFWKTDHAPASGNLYEIAITQATAALAAAGANARIAGVCWLQGEQDAAVSAAASYAANLDALIDGLRTRLGIADLPFVVGQMVPDYMVGRAQNLLVNAIHVDTPRRKTRTAFAYGLPGTGATIHYTTAGYRAMGRAMAHALVAAKVNVLNVPPVAPKTLVALQAGANLLVSWTRQLGRATDYQVQYRVTGAGSWTSTSRTSPNLDATDTVPIMPGSTYDIRVATINEIGSSAYLTATVATVAAPVSGVTDLAQSAATVASETLTFTPVAGATSYLAEYKTHASPTWLSFGTITGAPFTVTGLAAGTSYDFRVTPQNVAGSGPVSNTATASTSAATLLLADVGVTAYRAYGLRKLNVAFAGSAIRVRRSSDNTEQDIGFVSNALDTAALLTFAGAGNAFIKTLYDQSGSARDISQATAAAQPRIVLAGVLDTKNGLPTMVFDGVDDCLGDAAPGLYAAGAMTALTVLQSTGTAGRYFWSEGNSASANGIYDTQAGGGQSLQAFNDAGATVINSTGFQSVPLTVNTQLCQMSLTDTGSLVSYYVDNVNQAGTATAYTRSGVFTQNKFTLGGLGRSTNTLFWGGTLSEIVLFAAALNTAQRQAGQSNQKAQFATA